MKNGLPNSKKPGRPGSKERLAEQICNALKVHTTIQEEIFYPAFLAATGDKDLHHEAQVEHKGAKRLIAEIEASLNRMTNILNRR